MTPDEREIFYNQLQQIIRRLERTYARVYPYMLIPHLPGGIYRAEQTLRRDCADMARRGMLIRIGGPGARRGYSARRDRVRVIPLTPPVSCPPPLRRAA